MNIDFTTTLVRVDWTSMVVFLLMLSRSSYSWRATFLEWQSVKDTS